jgi:hypothetical protein
MSTLWQRLLLAVGGVAFLFLTIEIALSIAATTHNSTPARVVRVTAGPYALTVSLYTDPARAGFALPFAIAPERPTSSTLTYQVTSVPGQDVDATPVHASLSRDARVPNGVQGEAEITVQGDWSLQVVVNGPAGQGEADVPVRATAPPPMPPWLAWSLGFLPLGGLLIFLLVQRGRIPQSLSASEERQGQMHSPAGEEPGGEDRT